MNKFVKKRRKNSGWDLNSKNHRKIKYITHENRRNNNKKIKES